MAEVCYIEGKIQTSKLIALESNNLFTAASRVTLETGEEMTLIGDCAFGNQSGTLIKAQYSAEYPEVIMSILRAERLPISIVPNTVTERRAFSDFTPPEGAVFSSLTLCFQNKESQ